MANLTPDQLSKKLSCIQAELRKKSNIKRLGNVAMARGQGDVSRRVFNDGRATDGNDIGQYASGAYREKKVSRGQRVDKVRLQYNGDLRNSFIAGNDNQGNPALGFTKTSERLKAQGNTEYRGKKIFQPSEKEIKTMQKIVVQQVRELIKSVC